MGLSVQDAPPRNRPVRAAMWSVYYHTFFLQTLRRSVLELANRGLGPIPLDRALETVLAADDALAQRRRLRVLERLGLAGFTSSVRMDELRAAAREAADERWLKRIDDVQLRVENLSISLKIDWQTLSDQPQQEFRKFLYSLMPALIAGCQVTDSSCETCYDPADEATSRPLTTVTARARVSQTPEQLAKIFDPRSWGTCFDQFQTQRVRDRDASGNYLDFVPDNDPIGRPWPSSSEPHLFFERVTLETETNSNIFENVLRIKSFTVSPSHARLEFVLRESRKLVIPGLGINMNECVTIDEGHLDAVAMSGAGGPWTQLELVKRVQYVDITQQGSNDPLGLEPGELLNYYAPALLSLWLEDATKGAACCPV
jgi:hypothetical protein